MNTIEQIIKHPAVSKARCGNDDRGAMLREIIYRYSQRYITADDATKLVMRVMIDSL